MTTYPLRTVLRVGITPGTLAGSMILSSFIALVPEAHALLTSSGPSIPVQPQSCVANSPYTTNTSLPLCDTSVAPDTTLPSAPTNLAATPVSSSQINLSWTASTDNVGVQGYKVYRNGVQIDTVTSGNSYSDTGISASTTYYYTISTFDAAANKSTQSNSASATTKTPAASGAVNVSVAPSSGDAEEQQSTGRMYGNSSDLELAEDPDKWGSNAATLTPSDHIASPATQASAVDFDPDWLPESALAKQPAQTTGNYYVATNGSDANPGTIAAPWKTIQKAVDAATPGTVILVRGGTYNQRVIFRSANSGNANNYITLASYPGENAVIDGTGIAVTPTINNGGTVAGLVEVNGSYVRVSGFTVQNVAGTGAQMGILVQNGAHIIIDNNHTVKTASAGIGAWYANSIIIRNNKVEDGRTTGSQECLSLNRSTYFEVSYNTVWNTQAWSQTCEGIDVKNGSANGRIVKNIAHDMPLECIYVDAYDAYTHDIDVYGNFVHNCTMGIVLTSEKRGPLQNIRVFDNVVYDTSYIGIGFPAWGGSLNNGAISNISIYNNTIDNRRGPYPQNPSGMLFRYPNMSNFTIRNNIIATNGRAFTFDAQVTGLTVDHNLVFAPTVSSGMPGFNDPYLVQGDPKFVNVTASDYHLTTPSPAIDKGNNAVALAYDFDGIPRPQGSMIDIGAFELTLPAQTTILNIRVAASSDDAEERKSTGSMYLNSSDLELTEDSESYPTAPAQVIGMRFANVAVPKGAVITKAYVQFTAKETAWNNVTPLIFQGQASDTSASFSTAGFNVSSRPRTAASVSWAPVVWNTSNQAGRTSRHPAFPPSFRKLLTDQAG